MWGHVRYKKCSGDVLGNNFSTHVFGVCLSRKNFELCNPAVCLFGLLMITRRILTIPDDFYRLKKSSISCTDYVTYCLVFVDNLCVRM